MFFIRRLKWEKYTVKIFDVVSLGEILIDFTQKSVNDWNLPQIRAVRRVMFWHNYQGLGKKPHF